MASVTGDGKLILVAEDNLPNQILVRKLLEKLGYHCQVVDNGQEAVKAITSGAPVDAILMDVQMPVMDGEEATRTLRKMTLDDVADGGTDPEDVPIIALTSEDRPGDRKRFLSAGMDDYLTKPVKADFLKAALERCLNPGGLGLEMLDSEGPVTFSAINLDILEEVKEAAGDLTLVVTSLRTSLPDLLKDLLTAHSQGRLEDASIIATEIRGAAGNIGAEDLAQSCKTYRQSQEQGDQDQITSLLPVIQQQVEALLSDLEKL